MKKYGYIIVILGLLLFNGCRKQEPVPKVNQHFIITAEPYLPVMKQEVDQYLSLYPKVKFDVKESTTREAIVNLLNDSVKMIVIDRQFNEEEVQVAKQASIRFYEYVIAKDGIAIIVNKENPVKKIIAESAKQIVASKIKDWKQIPESRKSGVIEFVLTERNSGMYELLQKILQTGSKQLEPNVILKNQAEVIKYVSSNPNAIGFVSASLVINSKENIKVLPVVIKSKEGGESEYLPGQQEIYASLYPFQYSLYLYNTEFKDGAGIGFSAFVLSNIGQTIIQKASLVPASIPYRTIQLTTE